MRYLSFLELGIYISKFHLEHGGLAQLARAPALHAGGHRFDSDILHKHTHESGYLIRNAVNLIERQPNEVSNLLENQRSLTY